MEQSHFFRRIKQRRGVGWKKLLRKARNAPQNGCNKILLVNIPRGVGEIDLIWLIQIKRYSCFPPYGLGLLSHGPRVAGYSPLLSSIPNFEILSSVNDLSFRYDRWQNDGFGENHGASRPRYGWSKLHVFSKPRINESSWWICQNELSANSNHCEVSIRQTIHEWSWKPSRTLMQ